VPAADVLAGHAELAGDLGLRSGRRQIAPRPACGRLRTPGGRVDRGRCGGRRLVSYRHAARTAPTISPERANPF
jgi:hypothetical protein